MGRGGRAINVSNGTDEVNDPAFGRRTRAVPEICQSLVQNCVI